METGTILLTVFFFNPYKDLGCGCCIKSGSNPGALPNYIGCKCTCPKHKQEKAEIVFLKAGFLDNIITISIIIDIWSTISLYC